MREAALISLGAIIGANGRYWLGLLLAHDTGNTAFPWPTFIVNITGCLLLGAFLGFTARTEDATSWRLFFAVGFCGSYTTFSTFSWEFISLLRESATKVATAYAAGSFVIGTMLVAAGYSLGRLITKA